MTGQEILAFQEKLAKQYNYKPIPISMFTGDVREFFAKELPDWCVMNGANTPIYSMNGTMVASGYERVVIGDYGAFLEFSEEQVQKEAVVVAKGQEYRINDERYSKHCKYIWYTANDDSNVKIYFQKKTVDYADYKMGMYYVSPYEVMIKQEKYREK